MRRPLTNLVAGFLASGVATLAGLLVVPVYLRLLGPEGYGFIALFMTLQALLQVFDVGLTTTANREVARVHGSSDGHLVAPLLRTLGWLMWGAAAALTLVLLGLAPVLSHHWLQLKDIPGPQATTALLLMALALGLRWPAGLYQNVLLGADRLARWSLISGVMTVAGHGGAALLLWASGGELLAFFAWQLLTAIVHVLWVRRAAGQAVPRGTGGPDFSTLRGVRGFSLGMGVIGITGLALMHVDKLILSRLLALDAFGHYMVAWLVAGCLYAIVMPVFNWAFPRLTLLATRDAGALETDYALISHVLACALFPIAMLLVVSGESLLAIWLGDAGLAAAIAPLLALLVAGSALHCVMFLPFALALAKGATGVASRIGLALLLLMVPSMIALTLRYGAMGAAAAWLLLHVVYLLFGGLFTHATLLPAVRWSWLRKDVGPGLLVAVAIGLAGHMMATGMLAGASAIQKAAWGVGLCVLAWTVSLLGSRRLRQALVACCGWRRR